MMSWGHRRTPLQLVAISVTTDVPHAYTHTCEYCNGINPTILHLAEICKELLVLFRVFRVGGL